MKNQVIPNRNIRQTLFHKTVCGALVLCLLAACKSAADKTSSGAGIMKTEEIFFASILDHTFRFETLSARLKLEFKSPEKEMSSRAQLKMIYNDRIQLSLQPLLGIEMFRIELTADSVKILDRMNKRFMMESYENIKGKSTVDFNFNNLQALFANNLFIPGEGNLSLVAGQFRRFRMTKDKHSVNLKIKDETGMLYTFTTGEDEILRSISIHDKSEKYTLTWDYSDFQTVDKQRFPFKMEAELTTNDKKQGAVTFTFSPPEINSPLRTDFNIPAGYKQVTFSQIMKLIDKQ
ncbi:MAG: DUF4292 domain-containing protein [Tannerella sp.]|jgi:hypothetical protein|nr:DUF4292 domain-containing protein [Tannerella sp.]